MVNTNTSPVRFPGRLTGRTAFFIALPVLLAVLFLDTVIPTESSVVSPYLKHILMMWMTYSTLTLSLNIVTGYTGQTSLGHAAFFGFGAFTSAVLTTVYHVPFWVAFLVAGLVTALFAIPLGAPALRIRGHFLVVVTYGFGEVLRYIALNTDALGGTSGIPGVPAPSFFWSFNDIGRSGKEAYILAGFLLLTGVAYFVSRMENSPTGLAFAAIREDEVAAGAMGVNPSYYKLLAFSLAGLFAGFAGSLHASYLTFVSSDLLGSYQSILILTMVVVGGTRSIAGSILGAGIVVVAPEVLKYLKELLHLPFDPWLLMYGLLLVIMMRVRPDGILGADNARKAGRRR